MSLNHELASYSPTVVMDIKLGQKYSFIDFDYEAFAEECEAHEIPLQKVGELTLKLSDRRLTTTHGNFIVDDGNSEITLSNIRTANQYLSHELSHMGDWYQQNEQIGLFYRISMNGGTTAAYMGVAAIALTAADRVAELGINDNVLTATNLGILAGLLTLTFGYSFHPDERKARAHEKQVRKPFFVIER